MFHVKNREVVLTGQELGEGIGAGENCFKEGAKVFSAVQGLVGIDKNKNAVRVIPLVGPIQRFEEVWRFGWFKLDMDGDISVLANMRNEVDIFVDAAVRTIWAADG